VTSWRRTVENETKVMQQTRGSLTKLTQDRQEWRQLVAALHTMVEKDDVDDDGFGK
jgi:hypothetical protein